VTRLLLPFVVAALLAAPLRGQSGPRMNDETLSANPGLWSPSRRAARPPALLDASRRLENISIDGHMTEAEWDDARVFSGFTQQEPVEGIPAEQDTEVRVLFGEDAIWVFARMWDPTPERIDRRLTRRDSHGTFDQFSVHLDPNLDGLTGYRFAVSAANVQSDSYFYDDTRMDFAWDAVWSSATALDDEGWTVEMRIPLSQIRYEASDEAQTWGVNFFRQRVSSNERSYYTLVSRTRQGMVSQMGRIDGVLVARPARRIEARPYVVSSLRNGPAEAGDPFFDGTSSNNRVGVDLRYGLGAAFTLDATVNPDFGQVEADPAVINLTAFEVFFPEQRPFFVEDARVFDFGLSGGRNSLFYSRRIGRAPQGSVPGGPDFVETPDNATILGAAKVAGRTSTGLSLGALSAVTGNEYAQGAFADGSRGEFLVEPRTTYSVVSVGQDLDEGATQIKALASWMNRDLPGDGSFDWLTSNAFNGGIRFEHQWGDRTWGLWGFFAGSHVRGSEEAMLRVQTASTHLLQRPDATRFSVDPDARSLTGRDWRLQFEKRNGRHWTGSVWAAEVSNVFDVTDLGFSTNAERLDGGFRIGYKEIQPGNLFRNYDVSLSSFHNWSHEALDDPWDVGSWHDARTNGNYSVNANGEFLNWWSLRSSLRYSPQQMSRNATRGGPRMVGPGSISWNANLSSDRRRTLHVSVNYDQSRDLIGGGASQQIRADVNLRPSDGVSVSVAPSWETSSSSDQYVTATSTLSYIPTFGYRYLFSDLDRTSLSMVTRLDWTFTPRLSLQLFAQPLLSSGDYVQYKQLSEPGSFDFTRFASGVADRQAEGVHCAGGSICELEGVQYVDFSGDGLADYSFSDRDFNVRSLVGNAVLRWEYRPGSTIFFVWQRNQLARARSGDFDLDRDVRALFNAPAENRFIIKMNYWLGL
jgi:hypothetical protein